MCVLCHYHQLFILYWLSMIFDSGSSNSGWIHQICDSTSPWLRTWPCNSRLVNECRVGTPICQNFILTELCDHLKLTASEEREREGKRSISFDIFFLNSGSWLGSSIWQHATAHRPTPHLSTLWKGANFHMENWWHKLMTEQVLKVLGKLDDQNTWSIIWVTIEQPN